MQEMDVLRPIMQAGDRSTREIIVSELGKQQDPAARLQRAMAILDLAQGADELLSEVVVECWDYIESNKLWTAAGHASLDTFKEKINYEMLQPLIERSKAMIGRKEKEVQGIKQQWDCLPRDALPKDLVPPRLSDHFLRALHRLSKLCSHHHAVSLLHATVQARLLNRATNHYLSHHLYLTLKDVLDSLKKAERSVQQSSES